MLVHYCSHVEYQSFLLKTPCSPSEYDRCVYLKPDWDLRLFTPIPRGSQWWKDGYKARTSVERSLKRTSVDYEIDRGKVHSEKHWFSRSILAAINQHLDAEIQTVTGASRLSSILGLT